MPQLPYRNQRLEGMGGKFTFWEARATHRSVTHLPRSADTQGPCSHSHLFNPSAPRLAVSCWLRKHKAPGCFLEPVSKRSFVKQRPSCQVIQSARSPLPPGSCTSFLQPQPQPLSAQGSGAAGRTPRGLPARPLCTALHHHAARNGAGQGRRWGIWGSRLENGGDHRSG